jgi:hypothetical protein
VFEQVREPRPGRGLALGDALDQRPWLGLQSYGEHPVGANGGQQLGDIGVGLKRRGEDEQVVAVLAIELAVQLQMPRLLLVGERGVRPHQRLDLNGHVRDVVIGKRVGERGQHCALAGAGRTRDDDREHDPQFAAARRREGRATADWALAGCATQLAMSRHAGACGHGRAPPGFGRAPVAQPPKCLASPG